MIELVDVTQHYGVKPVLRNLNLQIKSGQRVAVIGPNGMGKTTLLGVMAGVLQPQRGYAEIDTIRRRSSVDAELEIRRKTYYLPDQPWLPLELTGREFLLGVGKLYKIDVERLFDHIEKLLRIFELHELGDSPVRTYSAGQKKKIALSAALVTEVPVLLLDEPFSGGLDPSGILALKHVLKKLAENRKATVVFTSPVPELVEEIADRIVVLRDGEIIADGNIEELQLQTDCSGSLSEILERLIFPKTVENLNNYFEEYSS